MKLMIFLGAAVCSSIGSLIGNIIDYHHINWASVVGLGGFGTWTLILSTIGLFVGVWVGYKAARYMGM